MKMNSMPDRYRYHISNEELERRWTLVRAEMEKEDVDCLIVNAYDNMLGGYLRWFIDVPVADYPMSLIFHRNDNMTVLGHNGFDLPCISPSLLRGADKVLGAPMMPTLLYTNRYIPDLMIADLKKRGYKKVGFVALATIPATVYQYLREELKDVEFVDATELVDKVKSIKSAEEIGRIREVAKLHDKIIACLPAFFRAGRYECEVTADIRKLAGDLGAECVTNICIGAEPELPFKQLPPCQYRRLQEHDKVFCLIEVNGPGGYYAEMLKVLSIGEPDPKYVAAGEDALECLDHVASKMKPGMSCAELFKMNNEFLTERGYLPESRFFAHGQGYDMVERPAFVAKETMDLAENMFITLHPTAMNSSAIGIACNSYLITKDGYEQITTAPNGIIVC